MHWARREKRKGEGKKKMKEILWPFVGGPTSGGKQDVLTLFTTIGRTSTITSTLSLVGNHYKGTV